MLSLSAPWLFCFSMSWWGKPTVVTNFMEGLYHFVVAKFFPLGLIALLAGICKHCENRMPNHGSVTMIIKGAA